MVRQGLRCLNGSRSPSSRYFSNLYHYSTLVECVFPVFVDPVRIKEEPVVGAVSVIRSISDLRHIEKIQESGEDTVGVSSPVPHPLDTEDASSLAHIRSSRRKGARPQRVPQTAAQNGEASPSAATASAAPVIHLPIKEEITNNNVQPPYQPNDIFLIYENSGGIQQGSLLLVTPSAPILKQPFEFPVLNDSYLQPGTSGLTWANAHSGSSMTMANNGAYACKNSAKNPIVLRSSEESVSLFFGRKNSGRELHGNAFTT